VQRIPVEQLGEMPNRAEPPPPPRRVRRVNRSAEVRRQTREPRLVKTSVDRLQQGPHRSLRWPRIRIGVDARRCGDRVADEPSRRREFDVGAHPIATPGAPAEAIRYPLRKPALHPARWHRDELDRERVGQWIQQKRTKRLDEGVGPFCSMDAEHVAEFRRSGGSASTRTSALDSRDVRSARTSPAKDL